MAEDTCPVFRPGLEVFSNGLQEYIEQIEPTVRPHGKHHPLPDRTLPPTPSRHSCAHRHHSTRLESKRIGFTCGYIECGVLGHDARLGCSGPFSMTPALTAAESYPTNKVSAKSSRPTVGGSHQTTAS